MRRLLMATLTAATLAVSPAWATTIHVPGDQPTIQAGIDAAAAGDTVLVACGTYYEHDIVMKDGVCVRSQTGSASCVTINAEQQGRVFYCNDVDRFASLANLTITGGFWNDSTGPGGAGMLCDSSALLVTGCVFTGNEVLGHGGAVDCRDAASSGVFYQCVFSQNTATQKGGAVRCYYCSPTFVECRFEENTSDDSGGALYYSRSSPVLIDCKLAGNSAPTGGAVRCYFATPYFEGCCFAGNLASKGGAICWNVSSPSMSSCTFTGNTATSYGSSLYGYTLTGYSANLIDCILAFGSQGEAVSVSGGSLVFTCCDIYGNAGGDWTGSISDQYGVNGNFSADPMFCDPDDDNFMLDVMSPCAPDNNSCGVLIGAYPVGCGASPVEATSWGRVKAMYR